MGSPSKAARWAALTGLLAICAGHWVALNLYLAPAYLRERERRTLPSFARTTHAEPLRPPSELHPVVAPPEARAPDAGAVVAVSNEHPSVVTPPSGTTLRPELEERVQLAFRPHSWRVAESARNALGRVVQELASHPEAPLALVGRGDDTGDPEVDRELGRRRALATSAYLQGLGIAADRITFRAPGASASSQEPNARAARNRVEVLWQTGGNAP